MHNKHCTNFRHNYERGSNMIRKYLLVGALVAPFTIVDKVNAFEFPDKPPFGELSANVSYYTNYIWRGEEQTGGLAIQGGFDYGVGPTGRPRWEGAHRYPRGNQNNFR